MFLENFFCSHHSNSVSRSSRRRVHNRDSILIEKCIIHNFEVVSSASFIRQFIPFPDRKVIDPFISMSFRLSWKPCKRGRTKNNTTRNSKKERQEERKKDERMKRNAKTEIIIMFMPCMRRLYVVYNVLAAACC